MKKRFLAIVVAACSLAMFTAFIGCGSDGGEGDKTVEHTHTYKEKVIEPTCVTGGYTVYTCTGCNDSYKDDETQPDPTKHKFETYAPNNNATCQSNATETAICVYCNEATDTRAIPDSASGAHTDDGSGVCSVCGANIEYSTGFTYAIGLDDHYQISGIGTCTDTELKIPATYNGEPITSIGARAFSGNRNITSVTIGNDQIKTIHSDAFKDCTALTSVTLGSSVNDIYQETFSGCTALEKLDLGGVMHIEEKAFSGCNSLTELSIPNDVQYLGEEAFSDCSNLERIYLGSGLSDIGYAAFKKCAGLLNTLCLNASNTTYKSEAGCLIKNNTVILGSRPSVIPDYIKEIGAYAFSGTNYEPLYSQKELTFPQGLLSIAEGAFSGCKRIQGDVALPDSLTTIGDKAFESCRNLISIELPDTALNIGEEVFSRCDSLESVKLPAGLTSISEKMFSDCYSLTSVVMPTSLTTIGERSFSGCRALQTINIPSTVTSIKEGGFTDSGLTAIVIPEGVTQIGDIAFELCESLASITLPDSLTEIGSDPFKYTAYSRNAANYENGVMYIGDYLLASNDNCPSSLTVKSGTKIIAAGAFYGNGSIGDVTVPDSVITVGAGAFFGSSATSIMLGSGVEILGDNAFRECGELKKIGLPASYSSIGDKVFEDCESIEEIHFGGTVSQWLDFRPERVMKINEKTKTLYINGTLVEGTLVIPAGITSIEAYAFSWTEITGVSLPASLDSIGEKAFYGCSNLAEVRYAGDVAGWLEIAGLGELMTYSAEQKHLYLGGELATSIEVPQDTKEICDYAFYGCVDIEEVVILSSVKYIGAGAFYFCSSLTFINIPEGVEVIRGSAFKFSGITSIVLPESLNEIKSMAFFECRNLTVIYYAGTQSEWQEITVSNDSVNTGIWYSTKYYYSERTPSEEGNYWHYDDDGVTPVAW